MFKILLKFFFYVFAIIFMLKFVFIEFLLHIFLEKGNIFVMLTYLALYLSICIFIVSSTYYLIRMRKVPLYLRKTVTRGINGSFFAFSTMFIWFLNEFNTMLFVNYTFKNYNRLLFKYKVYTVATITTITNWVFTQWTPNNMRLPYYKKIK